MMEKNKLFIKVFIEYNIKTITVTYFMDEKFVIFNEGQVIAESNDKNFLYFQ